MEGANLDDEISRLQIALKESTTRDDAVKISWQIQLLLLNRERRFVEETRKLSNEQDVLQNN